MLDVLLTARRDTQGGKRFLLSVLQLEYVEQIPRGINTAKYAVYPCAIKSLQESGELPEECEHLPVKDLNNLLEQEHRFVKLKAKAGFGFHNYWNTKRTIRGYGTINAINNGQIVRIEKGDIRYQNHFIEEIFGVVV